MVREAPIYLMDTIINDESSSCQFSYVLIKNFVLSLFTFIDSLYFVVSWSAKFYVLKFWFSKKKK